MHARFGTTTNGTPTLPLVPNKAFKVSVSAESKTPVGELRKTTGNHESLMDNVVANDTKSNSPLFLTAVNPSSLKVAWHQLKTKSGMMTPGTSGKTLSGIDEAWFDKASQLLMKGEYKYPHRRRIQIPKSGKTETMPITISDPKSKIIERAILNVLEPKMEGVWTWTQISELRYDSLRADKNIQGYQYKKNKEGFFEKT